LIAEVHFGTGAHSKYMEPKDAHTIRGGVEGAGGAWHASRMYEEVGPCCVLLVAWLAALFAATFFA
jgi:hypothetical protein